MKTKYKNSEKYIEVKETILLSLVSSKLKGRVLFPKKLEEARKVCSKLM